MNEFELFLLFSTGQSWKEINEEQNFSRRVETSSLSHIGSGFSSMNFMSHPLANCYATYITM